MKRKALFLALAGLSAAALLSGCGNIGARVAEFRSARSSGVETVSERFVSKGTPGMRAEMFSSVRLVTDARDGVVRLPAQCVIERYGETFVFAVNGESRVEKLPVRLGLSIDGIVEIISGVMEGTRVVAARGASGIVP